MSTRTSHITRSRDYLRRFGIVDTSEHYVSIPGRPFGVTRDLFGIFDLIYVSDTICGVQVTSASNITVHKKKIEDAEITTYWLQSGGEIILHLWKKNKSNRWMLKIFVLVQDEQGEPYWTAPNGDNYIVPEKPKHEE